MAATSVGICSNALLLLGDTTIASFDEGTDRARIAANLYPQVRDAMLRSHPWNCAVKRVVLAPESSPPAFDYAAQFVVPGDLLRILQVGSRGAEMDYKVEGRRILANASSLQLRYLYRNEVEATWDAQLIDATTYAMAAAMAYPITESTSLRDSFNGQVQALLKQARAVDGQEDPPETLGDFHLISARYGAYSPN